MKYTFLIVDKLKEKDLKEIQLELMNYSFEYEIVYANVEETFALDGVTVYNFDKEYDQDELLNRLIPKIETDNLVVVRKYTNPKEIVNLAKNLKKTNQIVVYKKQRNRVSEFFVSLLNKIILFLFHYNLYDANLSSIAFGYDAFVVMRNISTPSVLTKVNRWAGLDFVELQGGTNVKFKANLTPNIVILACLFVLFVGIIVLWVVAPNLFKDFIVVVASIAAMLLDIVFFITFSLKLYILCNVGKNQQNRANLKEM